MSGTITTIKLRQFIAVLAIISGGVFHAREMNKLIHVFHIHGIRLDNLLLPFYGFTTSLTLFGVLGLFDLTRFKNTEAVTWILAIFSASMLVMGGLVFSMGYYLFGALIFLGLNLVPHLISRNMDVPVNPNIVPLVINIFVILTTPF